MINWFQKPVPGTLLGSTLHPTGSRDYGDYRKYKEYKGYEEYEGYKGYKEYKGYRIYYKEYEGYKVYPLTLPLTHTPGPDDDSHPGYYTPQPIAPRKKNMS